MKETLIKTSHVRTTNPFEIYIIFLSTLGEENDIKIDITDTRTPLSTPPEKYVWLSQPIIYYLSIYLSIYLSRRKQNVEELHEMLEDFGSANLLSPTSNRSKGFLQPVSSINHS